MAIAEYPGVRMTPSTVIKSGEPWAMRVEYEKTRLARQISEASGSFKVPRIVRYSQDDGVLELERLPLVGWRRARLSETVRSALAVSTGRALRDIHMFLKLSPEFISDLPSSIDDRVNRVFVHGDFSTENVAVDVRDPTIPVLIDWQISPRIGGVSTFGTGFLDLAWFVCNLFRYAVRRRYRRAVAERSARTFLRSYFLSENEPGLAKAFVEYQIRFMAYRFEAIERRLPLAKRIALMGAHSDWREFATTIRWEDIHG